MLLQETLERMRRLSPLAAPVGEPGVIHIENTFSGGMERPDVFDVAPVAWVPMIGHDDAKKRSLLGAVSG
jgi:hypothetical protein